MVYYQNQDSDCFYMVQEGEFDLYCELSYDELKKKYNVLNDGSMMKNLEYTRDNALLNQQIEYLNKKNEETNKIIEDNQKRYEERLFTLRNEVEKDLNEKFDRLKKEKTDLENKLLSLNILLKGRKRVFLYNELEKRRNCYGRCEI